MSFGLNIHHIFARDVLEKYTPKLDEIFGGAERADIRPIKPEAGRQGLAGKGKVPVVNKNAHFEQWRGSGWIGHTKILIDKQKRGAEIAPRHCILDTRFLGPHARRAVHEGFLWCEKSYSRAAESRII